MAYEIFVFHELHISAIGKMFRVDIVTCWARVSHIHFCVIINYVFDITNYWWPLYSKCLQPNLRLVVIYFVVTSTTIQQGKACVIIMNSAYRNWTTVYRIIFTFHFKNECLVCWWRNAIVSDTHVYPHMISVYVSYIKKVALHRWI